jgi:hypothetical protein
LCFCPFKVRGRGTNCNQSGVGYVEWQPFTSKMQAAKPENAFPELIIALNLSEMGQLVLTFHCWKPEPTA